ncbi:hypothetical protein DD236_06755 [Ancrocorticia populi]|uniref:Uncharacterized protein n=2 Tax=Ancrocorticia populi TaxID=2175228 RepID=A0A2V1KAP8_9ACTO|nr:hypothetical protein DD236_06755 [Ancrocorticia populi]
MEWVATNDQVIAGIAGIATVITALVAVFTLLRAGLDSAERTRPYVVVEYRIPEYSYRRLELVVRNAGPTAARKLLVAFDPPFENSDFVGDMAGYVARRYREPISTLAPGQALTSNLIADLDNEHENDVPEILKATVTYKSPWWRLGNYKDAFILQRFVYTEQTFTTSSKSVSGRLETVAKNIGGVQKELNGIMKKLSE